MIFNLTGDHDFMATGVLSKKELIKTENIEKT